MSFFHMGLMPSAENSRAITDVNNKYHKVSSLLKAVSRPISIFDFVKFTEYSANAKYNTIFLMQIISKVMIAIRNALAEVY